MQTQTVLDTTALLDGGNESLEEAVFRSRLSGSLRYSAEQFRMIDLFAGAGGLSLGFSSAPLNTERSHVWKENG